MQSNDFETLEQETLQEDIDNEKDADYEHDHYLNEAEKLKQNSIIEYEREIDSITQAYLEETDAILQEGKDTCLQMVEDQREEFSRLEKEWRAARASQIESETESYRTRIATAKVLASYNCMDSAKKIKNSIQEQTADRSDELKEIDRLYMMQFKMMLKRHERDFTLLHDRVKARVASSKREAELQKLKADSDKETNDSQIPIVIMTSVSLQAKHEETKKRIMQEFSPRKTVSRK